MIEINEDGLVVEIIDPGCEVIEVSSARGPSATISVGTVTTGAAGTSATVTNSGTSGEAVLDFTIPMGDSVSLRINSGYLQWKNTTASTWTNILLISDITATVDVGTVATGEPNTDVVVTNTGSGKDAVFNFTIPRGDSVELRNSGTYLQWKTTTSETWNNIVAISDITATIAVGTVTTGDAGTDVAITNTGLGKDGVFNFTIPRGDDVQLRISEGYFQWKNTTASTWNNIYAISDIVATIEVGTVTTGDAGTNVTFINAGSGKDAVFNLSIPKGTTFTPSVSAEGIISFTNDGGLSNPTSVNIKGIQGDPAPNTIWQYSTDGTTWTTDATGALYERQSGDNGVTWSEAHEYPGVAALAEKANITDVNTALALKADITSLNEEKLLLTQEIDALKKSAVENSNAPYLTASDYGAVALAKNSVGVGQFGMDGVTVENLVANGDFSNGTTGWIASSSVLSSVDNILSIKGNNQQSYATAINTTAFTSVVGKKILLKCRARVTNSVCNGLSFVIDGSTAGDNQTYSLLNPAENTWYDVSFIATQPSNVAGYIQIKIYHSYADVSTAIDKIMEIREVKIVDLTSYGLVSLTTAQLTKLLPDYFSGKKTFGGVGCLVSKDSDSNEVGRQYFSTDPMYSNATVKDVLTYDSGKYYHTHNVDADGNAIATPYDTAVEVNGQFSALSNGTVTYEPWFPDIGIYTDKFTLSKAITAVKELYKYGSATPITDAVIASDGLSFTSASLTSGDLAYGVFEFEEPLRPLITVKSRNDDATVADTTNGKIYTFRPVITNGAIASWTVTEV